MAQTLSEPAFAEGTVHVSFPILKWEQDEDGDLVVKGVATDGTLDSDEQVVSPEWSAKALDAWISTGGNVRMSHDPRRPVGKGLQVEVNKDGSGKHWVTSVIVDRDAQKLIKKGVLTAYSVGIARPVIKHDPTGKARGGIIVGGELCELSVVDRPSNKNSYLEIAKAAADGTCEFTGKVFADDDLLTKVASDDDFVNVDLPKGASVSISPKDFAALRTLKQQLTVKAATVTTADHAASPPDDDGSTSKGTVTDTAQKADAPEVTDTPAPDVAKEPEPVKKAKKAKGKKMPPWLNKPGDDSGSDDGKGASGDDGACKGAHAWVHVGGDSPVPDIRCEKCKTTPAEAAGLSGTHDMTAAPVPDLLESPPMASTKGSPTPQAASGAGEAASMRPVPAHREPDGAIVEPFEKDAGLPATGQGETPTRLEAGMMKSSPEVAAILRFKAAGIDAELGRLHDLTCPAYHPEDVSKCHPFADLRHVDEGYFQRKAVEAACGPDLNVAKSIHLAWQAARVLRETDPGILNDFRLDAHKAFRDANPGPSSAPTPGMMTPGKYNRPLISDGHAATSGGHDGPNSSPQVATTAPDAHSFDRPPLAAGHQSPSPSHMKSSFEYPDGTGRPQQLNYAQMEKERSRMALVQMHDHLGRQFPEVCPMDKPGSGAQQREGHPVPTAVGAAKGAETNMTINVTGGTDPAALTAQIQEKLLATHARNAAAQAAPKDGGEFADDEVYKGFKKARKKLGKKVLSGKMTVDEARSRLGRQFSQKAAEPAAEEVTVNVSGGLTKAQVAEIVQEIQAGILKSAEPVAGELVTLEAANFATDPEIIKAAVAEATSELKELLVKQQETFTEKLADQQRVIDAIADQPDPSTAAFSGLAFNPVHKSRRPAGAVDQAEVAERTQQMMIRTLQGKYNSSSDPVEREAYYETLCKMQGITGP